jgi:hypothetical protein
MQRDCGLWNPLNTKIDMKVLGVNNCWAASILHVQNYQRHIDTLTYLCQCGLRWENP